MIHSTRDKTCPNDAYTPYLRQALVFLISQIVLNLTLSYKEEMKHYYHAVVNGLVSAASKHPDLIEAAKKPLDFLLKTYKEDYTECIVMLPPFPSEIQAFEEYREIYAELKYGERMKQGSASGDWPLHKELRSFLTEIEQSGSGRCSKERLEVLRELLSKRKRDLEKMVRSLDGKRFSDECAGDTLHCIIKVLLDVVKGSDDEGAVIDASRCLGEIGPVDLSVMVLPAMYSRSSWCSDRVSLIFPSPSFQDEFHQQEKCKKYSSVQDVGDGGMPREERVDSMGSVIRLLVEYLKSDQELTVVCVVGDVLRDVCHVHECLELVAKTFAGTRIEGVLKPFRPTNERMAVVRKVEKVMASLLETKLGLNEMNEYIRFGDWVMQLTCGLIECFKNDESLIGKLLPVCRLKVRWD
jgi:hypothetical protein